MGAPLPSLGPGQKPDPRYNCTCCRNILQRESHVVRSSLFGTWMVFTCPVCDAADWSPRGLTYT
jgi:hypothetical protein